jgi:hypothetical protein
MSTPARPALREAPYGYTLSLVPGAAEAIEGLVAVLWKPAGAVTPRTKELVFLRTSMVNKCET